MENETEKREYGLSYMKFLVINYMKNPEEDKTVLVSEEKQASTLCFFSSLVWRRLFTAAEVLNQTFKNLFFLQTS